ncbi:hypothetical protein [Dulcicalothrix desertica]|nr:hypothetical protein [Dulcicalothrix desertica]
MKKIIIFATIISLTIGASSAYAQTRNQSGNAKITSQNKINPNNQNQVKPPKKPTYKDNSRVPESKLISKEVAIGKLKDGATLIKAERKAWKDYQKGTNGNFHDIDGNRQIWEVEVNLPKGADFGRAYCKRDARAKKVVDAETDKLLAFEIRCQKENLVYSGF